MPAASPEGRPALASEIRELLGALDDRVVADILDVGASREELMEAKTWLASDDFLHRDLRHFPQGRAGQVLDILEAQLPDPDQP